MSNDFTAWLVDCKLTPPGAILKHNVNQSIDKTLALLATLTQNDSTKEEIQIEVQRLNYMLHLTPWMYNYFEYQRLVQVIIAHSGEDVSKTLFGNYRSAFLHSWESLRFQWSKGNAHLAHGALVLFQAIKHEIPCLKVSVERNQKMLQTIHAKSNDLSNHIDSETKSYSSLFEKHGLIAPSLSDSISVSELESKIFHDLTAVLSNALPIDAELVRSFFKTSSNLTDALSYHKGWTDAMRNGREVSSISALIDHADASLLIPIDTSTASKPESTDESPVVDEDAIDWGDYDFDMSSPSSDNVNLVEAVTLEKPHLSFRRALSIELEVLLAFFRQRQYELSIKNDFVDLVMGRSLQSQLPESVRVRDNVESMTRFIDGVTKATEALNQFVRKLDLAESDASRAEVVATLIAKRSKIGQLDRTLTGLKSKRAEIDQALSQVSSKAESAKKEIKKLQEALESELSQLCGGRRVSISVPKIDL